MNAQLFAPKTMTRSHGTLWAVAADVSTIAEQPASQPPSHDDTMHKKSSRFPRKCLIRTGV